MKTHALRCLAFSLFFCLTLLQTSLANTAKGQHGMVVSPQHLATEAGLKVLKQGGNAIDAAVAVGYALAVVHPCCGNIGGGGFMLIHLANGKNIFINFRETAPSGHGLFRPSQYHHAMSTLRHLYLTHPRTHAYYNVGVPGTVAGLNTALAHYGKLPLAQVIAPAIKLAKEGYPLKKGDISFLRYGTQYGWFKRDKNLAAIFLNQGQPYRRGETLKQQDLSRSLQHIAAQGSQAFYHGRIAKQIAKSSQTHGGAITTWDMAHYKPEIMQPITCQYRGYTIVTSPPPSSGGITICQILNTVEAYPLRRLGFHSATSMHYNIEAMRYAYADRNTYLGDPDFVTMPVRKLLSKHYAAEIRKHIAPLKAGDSSNIGLAPTHENNHTTSYVVADQYGNAVAVTYTLDYFFGSRVIAGHTGFFLNNDLDDFSHASDRFTRFGLDRSKANALAPNKRPLSSISPTMVFKGNHLLLALGTPGGATIPSQLVEVIENVVDYQKSLSAAVDAYRYHHQWLPDVVYEEPHGFSILKNYQLKKMGYHIKLNSPYHFPYWGGVTAIYKNPHTGRLTGAMDSRRPAGLAKGY